MNLSPSAFVTPEQVLSDVTRIVDDAGFKFMSKGFYENQIENALQELAFDTFFDQKSTSVPVPQNLRVDMPDSSFNIRNLYVFNGTKCNIATAQKLWHKRNYWTGGDGYLARDRGNNGNDPFYKHRSVQTDAVPNRNKIVPGISQLNDVYFYNIEGGVIMLSPNCRSFANLFIQYNGTGLGSSDKPVIPLFLKEAVKGWVAEQILTMRMAHSSGNDYAKWAGVYNIVHKKLRGERSIFDGDWYKAEERVKYLDKNEREDLKEYLTRLGY